jgi:hypothetical protein
VSIGHFFPGEFEYGFAVFDESSFSIEIRRIPGPVRAISPQSIRTTFGGTLFIAVLREGQWHRAPRTSAPEFAPLMPGAFFLPELVESCRVEPMLGVRLSSAMTR